MKKFFLYAGVCLFLCCNDGDIQVETLNFDENSTLQYCNTATTGTTLFFKVKDNEALVLNLQSGLLKNEASDGDIVSAVPGQSQITYRIFSDKVSKNYFCDAIPPVSPTVTKEINAEAGEVHISTIQSEKDSTAYEHTITLKDISLVTGSGSRITDLRINDFGTVTTKE